jgi:hypothetical protein
MPTSTIGLENPTTGEQDKAKIPVIVCAVMATSGGAFSIGIGAYSSTLGQRGH